MERWSSVLANNFCLAILFRFPMAIYGTKTPTPPPLRKNNNPATTRNEFTESEVNSNRKKNHSCWVLFSVLNHFKLAAFCQFLFNAISRTMKRTQTSITESNWDIIILLEFAYSRTVAYEENTENRAHVARKEVTT